MLVNRVDANPASTQSMAVSKGASAANPTEPFLNMVFDTVNRINAQSQAADTLQQEMVVNPDAVDIHEVVIASEKVRLSVAMLRSVVNRATQAYTDILSLR